MELHLNNDFMAWCSIAFSSILSGFVRWRALVSAVMSILVPRKMPACAPCVQPADLCCSVGRASSPEQPFVLYRLSYLYFNVLGCFIVIVVGLVVSFLTGATSSGELHPDLLSPVVHWILPKKHKDQYQPVKQAVDLKTAR